jgi:hypothetical protein
MTKEYNKHADTEEYWNPHKRCYEVEINGKEYVITPENVGFQDGRINCYIWVDGKEYEISNINKPWAERNFYYGKRHYGLERANSLFSAIALLNLPQTELELIVKAALDRCPNATEDFRNMNLNAFNF